MKIGFCSVLLCKLFWICNVMALVPIPLEPQRPCFTHFGECIRYCPGERIPDLEGIESSCITNTAGYQFCKFYHCPPTDCRRRKKDLYGKCYYCPGKCVDGGRTHRNGQAFHSFDMVNSCFCGQDNSKHCTKHPVDQYSYCNHARPNTDVENNQNVVVVERQPPPPPPPKPQVVVVEQPPPPPPPQTVAYVPQPPAHQPAPQMAFVPPPSQPPTQPPYAYVPPPSQPPTSSPYAHVPQPGNYHHNNFVPHPNFSAKSPKSNLEQRSQNNPNLPMSQYRMYPNNPFYGQFPPWGFNPFNKEGEM